MKIHFYFWQGFLACIALIGLMQDFIGQEAYIRVIQENWVSTHWMMWLALLALAFGSHVLAVAIFGIRKGPGA